MSDLPRFFAALDALPDEQRRGVLPVVVLMFVPLVGEALPAELREQLAEFERALALPPNADDATKKAAFDAHMKKHGITSSVWRDLTAALTHASPSDLSQAAQKLVGTATSRGVLERTSPPPAGTVGAGPFARFSLNKK